MAQVLYKGDPNRGRIIRQTIKGKLEEFLPRRDG